MAKDKSTTPEAGSTGTSAGSSTAPATGASAESTAGAMEAKTRSLSQWFRIGVIALFGVFYARDQFEAVSNLLGKLAELARINEVRELNGFVPIDTPWSFLVANLALPVVVFGLALLITRKRNVGVLAVVLLAGLGVVAALSLSFTSFVLQAT